MSKKTISFNSDTSEIDIIKFRGNDDIKKIGETISYSIKDNKKRQKIATNIYHSSLKDKLTLI